MAQQIRTIYILCSFQSLAGNIIFWLTHWWLAIVGYWFGSVLLPDGAKPVPKPTLTYRQGDPVSLICW